MKYYVIAGEASGDLHGSNLIKALRKVDQEAQFRAWGGDRMAAEGAELVKHYRDLAFMGFVEVLMNLKTILGNLKFCKADIESYDPDVLILIDYPGFNMRIAEYARERGLKVIYYISPQIWAWKKNRGYKLKRDVDRMLCILPFEKEFYKFFDMEVDFVGHPLLDEISERQGFDPAARKEEMGLSTEKVIALLPGSRKQEISSMLPVMAKAATDFPGYQVVVAGAPSQSLEMYEEVLGNLDVKVVSGRTYDLLEISDAALVTSGTATLETALFGVPEVVCYKGNWVSYWIARMLVKVPYISLVNLIADREMVKELIQAEMNTDRLKEELKSVLDGNGSERLKKDYTDLKEILGGPGASDKAAQLIMEELKK